MAKLHNYIKNSDFDASFQQYGTSASVRVPGGWISAGQVYRQEFGVPPGVYVSDAIAKTNHMGAGWRQGNLSRIHAIDGERVNFYAYVRRVARDKYSAEVYIQVYGGTGTHLHGDVVVDFRIMFSELPV